MEFIGIGLKREFTNLIRPC